MSRAKTKLHPKRAADPKLKRPGVVNKDMAKLVKFDGKCANYPSDKREKMTQTEIKREHDFLVRLFAPHKVNRPWLEEQAVKVEDALIGRFPDVPEPAVTANFEENGFELDLIVQARSMAEAYDKLGKVLEVVEGAAGIKLGNDGADEVRSDYASAPDAGTDHDFAGLAPTAG